MIPDWSNGGVSFGDWVRQRRQALDLTQAALAQLVGCAVVTIKKIEQEERRPSVQVAHLLADHLAIPAPARDAFIRMARRQSASASAPPHEPALPPPFLLRGAHPSVPAPSPFVARERELARLQTHLDMAMAGHGHAIFILGDAGCGKTTLMAEFARHAQATYPDLIVADSH